MNLGVLIAALRSRWKIAGCVFTLSILGGLAVFLVTPNQFSSTTTFYVSAQLAGSDATQAAYQGGLLSEQKVKSYTELVTSSRVGNEISTSLGNRVSASDVTDKITAEADPDSVVIRVSATDSSPDLALAITQQVDAVFPALVDELERPADPRAASPVAVRIVEQASPSEQVAPVLLFYIIGSLLFGALLAATVAVALELADKSVRESSEVARILGAPVIGSISRDSRVESDPSLALTDPQSELAENFRSLRTNLQFVSGAGSCTTLLVASAVPGEGKSTVALNLANVLAVSGSRVLLIEADLRRPALSERLHVEQEVGLSSVLVRRIGLRESIHRLGQSLDYLPAGVIPPNPSELLGSRSMSELLDQARSMYEYVIVDGAPVVAVSDSLALGALCDGAVVVCRVSSTARKLIGEVAEALQLASVHCFGAVLSMVPASRRSNYGYGYRSAVPASSDEASGATTTTHSLHQISARDGSGTTGRRRSE